MKTSDELRKLAREFSGIRAELNAAADEIDRLTAENERLKKQNVGLLAYNVGGESEIHAALTARVAELEWVLKRCRSESDNSRALNEVIDAALEVQP